jgi:hypothetical protein
MVPKYYGNSQSANNPPGINNDYYLSGQAIEKIKMDYERSQIITSEPKLYSDIYLPYQATSQNKVGPWKCNSQLITLLQAITKS